MKKFIVILLILFTWYFAGMYRQMPMMMLIVMGLLFVVFMFIISRYFRKNINPIFLNKSITTQKNLDTLCYIKVNNKGKLPITRFSLSLCFSYLIDKKSTVRKKLYGCADKGNDNRLEFHFLAPYCGIIEANIKNMRVYDYLMIFSSKKRIKNSVEVLVFPYERALHIELPSFGYYDCEPLADQLSNQKGDNHSEIIQIREYHTGDSNRFIHWNYTARTESLWVKEYKKENDLYFDFLIDTAVMHKAKVEEWDRFYEIVSAIILGLIEKGARVKVHWYDGKYKGINNFDVNERLQYKELMLKLYHSQLLCSTEEFIEKTSTLNEQIMRFNFNLEWYFDNRLIYKFSPTEWEREVSQMIFSI